MPAGSRNVAWRCLGRGAATGPVRAVEVAYWKDRAVGNAIVGVQRTAACAHTRRASQRDGVRGGR